MPVDVTKPLSGTSTVFGLSRFQCLILTELLLIASMMLMIASVLIPEWRVGDGSSFLYPPKTTQGFAQRSYGLIYVEALRKMTWAELATSTCDRWGMYINTKALFPIAPVCTNAPVDKAQCSSLFETHLYERCNWYSSITLTNWTTAGLMSVCTLLVAVTSISMLVVALGVWKRFLLAALCAASAISLPVLIGWLVTTTLAFSKLGGSATYPAAKLGLGFWVAWGGVLALLLATLIFWRLSQGLKLVPPNSGKMSTSNAGLLDMAEKKLLSGERIDDDTDDEAAP
jgi:hypothetical protein